MAVIGSSMKLFVYGQFKRRLYLQQGRGIQHRVSLCLLTSTLAPQNPPFETKRYRSTCPSLQSTMLHAVEAEEQARLLLELANGSRPHQGLRNLTPEKNGNVQPSPPVPPAATTWPSFDPSRNSLVPYLYLPLQTHGVASEQRPVSGGAETLAMPRQEPNRNHPPRTPMQQQNHEPMLAMAEDARSNHMTHYPSTLYLNWTSSGAFNAPANNNHLYILSSTTSSARSRAHVGKRPSHSVEVIHRAGTYKSTHASTPAPAHTYNLSWCLPVPVGQPTPYSNRFKADLYNTYPTSEESAGGSRNGQIATFHSANDTSNERASTVASAPPSFSSRKQRQGDSPPPEKKTWMYNIDTAHPSPSMQNTEEDNDISAPRVILPDNKTKRTPIREEDVTRYDILSGRGGKTNHHEGNKKFRRLVSMYKKDYLCAKRSFKRRLVSRIVRFVRKGRGRFLQKEEDGFWYEIGDVRACAKISQSMREGASVAAICREMIGRAPPRQGGAIEEKLSFLSE